MLQKSSKIENKKGKKVNKVNSFVCTYEKCLVNIIRKTRKRYKQKDWKTIKILLKKKKKQTNKNDHACNQP